MRGGGSAARAIAAAWAEEGGSIIPVEGRRALVGGPWDSVITSEGEADLAIDLDEAAGGGDYTELSAKQQVSISYGEDATADDFAVIMVAAQHLEAWKRLFAPKRVNDIPSLDDVLAQL